MSVKVINVNCEKGAEILKRPRLIWGYSRFMRLVREKQSRGEEPRGATERSIRECVEEGIMKKFFKRNGKDNIVSVLYEELSREQCEQIRWNDGYIEGQNKGRQEGIAEGRREERIQIAREFKTAGVSVDTIAECTGLSEEDIEAL